MRREWVGRRGDPVFLITTSKQRANYYIVSFPAYKRNRSLCSFRIDETTDAFRLKKNINKRVSIIVGNEKKPQEETN